jgi:hypothetical protein
VPISYRGALLSTLLHVSLIPTSHNRPTTYQLHRSATEHSSTCKSQSHKTREYSFFKRMTVCALYWVYTANGPCCVSDMATLRRHAPLLLFQCRWVVPPCVSNEHGLCSSTLLFLRPLNIHKLSGRKTLACSVANGVQAERCTDGYLAPCSKKGCMFASDKFISTCQVFSPLKDVSPRCS